MPALAASLATVSTEGVSLSGPLSVANGTAFLGNNGSVTAGDKSVHLKLTRGGNLSVCSTTQVHLSTDTGVSGGGLMIALNRGAIEGHYIPGQYSDVILTPDLRILISGPGVADFSLRVNNEGDTCFDNHGDHAPYVLATNLFEGGAYRVQPNQRVLFEHGSLQQVVDKEQEPCGCPAPPPTPAPTAIARVGAPGITLHSSGQTNTPPPAKAKTTAEENPFPLAQSEGLQPPPPPPSTPVVPPGQAHAEVSAPLVYNGEAAARGASPSSALATASTSAGNATDHACNDPLYPGVVCGTGSPANPSASPSPAQSATPSTSHAKPKKHSAFVRFLRKIFG
ncbi:MAG: hypothetical protein ACLGXA_15555 [Acidobacteriota bacterium]